jgi:nucleoside-diphosphate-sugar epimerase
LTRILVTGASGFIGRALVAGLAQDGHLVRAASRDPARNPASGPSPGEDAEGRVERVVSPDLSGKADWAPLLEGVDAIVHAAAIAHTESTDVAAYEAVNHKAVAALAEAARGKVGRLSSIRAQSASAAAGSLTEADPPRPSDPYGRAKLAAEAALAQSGTPFVIFRPVLVAGPRPSGNLASLLRLAAKGLPLRLDALSARRSLIARADVVAAVAHVLAAPAHLGETYILAHPEPITIGAMFASLREGLGGRPGGLPVPASLLRLGLALTGKGDMREKLFGDLVASPAKLMATGWTPRISPRAALAEIGAVFRREAA